MRKDRGAIAQFHIFDIILNERRSLYATNRIYHEKAFSSYSIYANIAKSFTTLFALTQHDAVAVFCENRQNNIRYVPKQEIEVKCRTIDRLRRREKRVERKYGCKITDRQRENGVKLR